MKKNVASQIVGAQLNSKTDGSAVTSGTTTVYYTLDGGTQTVGSVGSGAATHKGNGYWTYAPAQGETNGDLVAFTFVNTSAVTATVQIYTSFPQSVDNATNISAIKTKTDFLPSATAGSSGGVFIAGTNAATSVTSALTANITGNLSGSVGSVTGAVGSVTGNVGGNVVGSVGSVTGAVGSVTGAVGSVTGNVGGNVTGSVGSLATQAKADVNAEVDTALADVGVTTTVTGRIDAAISTRLASASYTAPDNSGISSAATDAATAASAATSAASSAASAASSAGTAATNTATLLTDVGTVDTVVDAIKAKTDSLTFTTAGEVDANIHSVNDVPVNGTGAPGDEWGP